MNKSFNKLLITILISSATSIIQAMEQPAQQQQPEMVTIITSDCPNGFKVERYLLIEQSETIRNILSDIPPERQNDVIPLPPQISKSAFDTVYQCMKIDHEQRDNDQRDNVRRVDVIQAISDKIAINPAKIKDVLYAASYLGSQEAVLKALARQYAIYAHDNRVVLDDLIRDNMPKGELLPKIAQQYYLHYREKLQHPLIADDSWGVSVRDLLKNNQIPTIINPAVHKLSLSGYPVKINNIDGLLDIPDIHQVKYLYLSDCLIQTRQLNILNELVNLRELYLDNNKINTIEAEIFKKLTRLETLELTNNKITTIQKGSWEGLNNLKFLALNNNQITRSDSGAWSTLTQLEMLNLDNNRLNKQEVKKIRQELQPRVKISTKGQKLLLGLSSIILGTKESR